MNEFGALEVITDVTEMESVKKATATTTWMVPTVQEGQCSDFNFVSWHHNCIWISVCLAVLSKVIISVVHTFEIRREGI